MENKKLESSCRLKNDGAHHLSKKIDRMEIQIFLLCRHSGHWTNAGFMLGQRRRRWPNIKPALSEWEDGGFTVVSHVIRGIIAHPDISGVTYLARNTSYITCIKWQGLLKTSPRKVGTLAASTATDNRHCYKNTRRVSGEF